MAKKSASGPRGSGKRGQHKPATPASKVRRSFTLANLQPPAGSRKKKVRVGRGIGSKLGKTAGAVDLKAGRCRCTGVCPSAASTIRSV